jgi:hypothetical protein
MNGLQMNAREAAALAIAATYGYETEIIGGGSYWLAKRTADGAHAIITCIDGGGLPDPDNFMLGYYAAAWDGEEIEYITSDNCEHSLEQVLREFDESYFCGSARAS